MFPQVVAAAVALAAAPLALAQGHVRITGASTSSGGAAPMRLDIDEFMSRGGPQWDLYIRSSNALQAQSYLLQDSFFQIAGIHGKPYIQWNGAGPERATGWEGYCPHGERIFLTWHRSYLALYEQTLSRHAKRIANTYPPSVRQRYVDAANSLRAPYWDWAKGTGVPAATVPTTMVVNVPSGNGVVKKTVNNPLNSYKIPKPVLDGAYGTFDPENRPRTVRCPAPQSYPGSANGLLSQRPYRQWVYDAFTRATNFSDFAFGGGNVVCLEIIHNGIHWDAACGSQFLSPDLAAFDPLFWLHHVQVDRLWAYWQAIKPNQGNFPNTDSYSGQSRYDTPAGTRITPQSPLSPFFDGNDRMYTSDSVSSIRNFGYSYQGLEYWSKSTAQMQTDARRLINQLYGPNGNAPSKRSNLTRRADPETRRYFAHVTVDRTELPRPCQIEVIYNGQRGGSMVVMKQPETGIMKAGLPLDRVIKPTNAYNLAPESARDTITKGLTVKIVKTDGTIVPHPKSLKVNLEDVLVTPPPSLNEFPKYGASKLSKVTNLKINLNLKVDVEVHASHS